MATHRTQVSIKGTSPILMHAFPMVPVEAIEKQSPEVQCEHGAYRVPGQNGQKGKFYVPGLAVQRALVNGAAYVKGKGRASLQKQAAASLMVSPEYLVLENQSPTIDTRPVVVPATKGRILRHRYRFDPWQVDFQLEWDDVLMREAEARKIVDETCLRVGFLDFRPEKKGPFGRGVVVKWQTD